MRGVMVRLNISLFRYASLTPETREERERCEWWLSNQVPRVHSLLRVTQITQGVLGNTVIVECQDGRHLLCNR